MAFTTIDDPEKFFQIKIYTGDGNDDRDIAFGQDNSMQPDTIWFKQRGSDSDHFIHNSVGGPTKYFKVNQINGEFTGADTLQAFNSDGFQLGTSGSWNGSSGTFVAWCWKKSSTSGHDVLEFTGNAGGNQTVSHSCGAIPDWFIIKRQDQNSNWCLYHDRLGGANKNLFINTTNSVQTDTGIFNNTAPTSSVFSVGNNIDSNGNGATHTNFLWATIPGFSKFGRYKGNNNNDGNYVYLGFRPAWVMVKDSASGQSWHIIDSVRETFNDGDAAHLRANDDDSEAQTKSNRGTAAIDFLSNGFKVRSDGSLLNGTGDMLYFAFAEAPMVNSNGVPSNAR